MSSSTYKVVLLGEGRVGKTSLISRFVKDKFDSEEASTVQANMYNKKRVSVDGRMVDLSIWDTAGQERFHALGPIYYRNSNGAVLVYDITDADTFEKVKMWIKELKQVVGDSISIVICGNKADMERDRDIDEAIAQKYANKESAQHFNTSARLNMNVTEAFEAVARAILEQEKANNGGGGGGGGTSSSSTRRKKKGALQIEEEEPAAPAPATTSNGSSGKGNHSSTAPPPASQDPYSYDSYDQPASSSKVPPSAPPPQQDHGGAAGGGGSKPRSKTIILTSTNKPSNSGNDDSSPTGSGGGGGKPTKKKEGCCS